MLRRRAGVNLVGHDFRNRQLCRRIAQNALQRIGERSAFLRVAEVENILFAIIFDFQICRRFIGKAHRREFFHQRWAGLTVRSQANRYRQYFVALLYVIGLRTHTRHQNRQTTRRGKRMHGTVFGRQAVFNQTFMHARCERIGEFLQRFRWQFFGQKFNQ